MQKSKYKISDNLYKCECGKEFNKANSLNGHFCHCKIHCNLLNKEIFIPPSHKGTNYWENIPIEKQKEYHIKQGKKLSENIKNNITIPNWLGKHHSEQTKQKIREKYVQKLEQNNRVALYNIKACQYIDQLNKENNWNLQHALNGGEIKCLGYWLDGYDKEKNIVFEYDEPRHYKDKINNILKDKDIKRQNNIIKQLNCEFWRYNEYLNLLYKVN